MSDWTEEHFSSSDALVFVGAMGIAVRAIAPFVKTKTNDPAVVVVDERGQFSIPVLSGHIGGANELANKIANILDAIPVISTATDINNVFAIDTWAKSQGLKILNPENIKSVSSKLLKGEEVHIKSEFSIVGDLPQNVFINDLNELMISINNNLIENKPDGQPFKDDLGVWHNIRTHYFDLDLIYNNKHYLTWSQWHDELIRSMNIWLVKAKPFHSELRNLSIILKRNTDFKFEIGTGTFQGTQHAIDFIQHTSSNTKFNMSIGTGTFHTWTHEIKHVQATEAENISAVYAGANVIQGVNHEVDFQQHTSGSSNINVIIGTGTFQNIRHNVKIQQATEAEGNSDIYAGANVIQGANHEVDIQQHTSGNSSLDIAIGTGTFQNIRHDVQIQQATDGKVDAVISAGAGIIQGSHHAVSIEQANNGNAGLKVCTGTAICQKHIHEVNIKQSDQNSTHNQISTGCALSCGIHIQIKMAA